MRGLNFPSALPLIQLKTAASRNDPPFKTLGLKTQNNTMTTSRLNLVIQSARICLQHAQNLQHLKTSEDTFSAGPSKAVALPHQSSLPCAASSLSAEPCGNHIYTSAVQRNKCKGALAEKDSHVMYFQPVAGATPTIQSTTRHFLQHATTQTF